MPRHISKILYEKRLTVVQKKTGIVTTGLVLGLLLLSGQLQAECWPRCSESEIKFETRSAQLKLNTITKKISAAESKEIRLFNELQGLRFNYKKATQTQTRTSTTDVYSSNDSGYAAPPPKPQRLIEAELESEQLIASIDSMKESALKLELQIERYQDLTPYVASTQAPQPAPVRALSAPQPAVMYMDDEEEDLWVMPGKHYALLVAVGNYDDDDINDLDQPQNDAAALKKVLMENYTFEDANVSLMVDPSRGDILDEFDRLNQIMGESDSLLIFYAGHGYWDEDFQQGYWLPRDARKSRKASWISNATIRDYIRGIGSKHTLLISDACFSGGIFKTRSAFRDTASATDKLFQLTSRKAMTSGTLTEVPDDSVFLEYLIKRLKDNTDSHLPSEQLFSQFRIAVINNSSVDQVPQYGEIRGAGDEGGDFIFVRRTGG